MLVQDRKNYSDGVMGWTLISGHKVRFLDMVLERKAGQHMQRPSRMAFELKTNPGFPIEEGSGRKFVEFPYGRVKNSLSGVRGRPDVFDSLESINYNKNKDFFTSGYREISLS